MLKMTGDLSVKELTDTTFEDLTQVASGSPRTWLIFLYVVC